MRKENPLLDKSLFFAARIVKLQISLKETAETEYWLRLLLLSDYINEVEGSSLLKDCLEIKRILIATLNTAKENK